jgi:hypothetical protein
MPHNRTTLATLAFSAFFAFGLAAPTVRAGDTPAVTSTTTDAKGYGFVFRDDPLQAAGLGGVAPRIAVVVHASRETLIRPRTAFVVEMLKSVENL